jgi:hypothetical protein
MKNLYVFIIVVVLIVAFVYIYNKRQPPVPAYVTLLRDDLYFYPPRFPVPRPQLRHHEMPHRRHFGHH